MGSRFPTRRGNFEGQGNWQPTVKELSAVSCANEVEPTEIQFGMLSQVGPGNHILDWGADALTGSGTFGGVCMAE